MQMVDRVHQILSAKLKPGDVYKRQALWRNAGKTDADRAETGD